MVLSNKKLKQKLRSTLTESLADAVARNTAKEPTKKGVKEESKLQVQSLKELLGSASQKPRLSKREIRRKKLPLPSSKTVEGESGDLPKKETNTVSEKKEITTVSENRETTGSEGSNDKKKKKDKKRKREEGEGQEKENGVIESAEKKAAAKAKKKRARKEKNKKKKKNNKKVVENNGEIKEEAVAPVQIDESQENVDVPSKVYVGGIPYYSSEDDIRSFFESCGTITEMDCMTFPETGKFRGIAMITFKTEAAAKRALALDGADMGGFFLKIQPYKISRPHKAPPSSDFAPKIIEGYNRVYVGNLAWDITEDDLKKLFADFNITKIRFGMDKESGEFRGYAHVDFTDSLSVSLALKLDQKEVCGRPARITCAVPKKDVKDRPISEPSNKKAENENPSNKKSNYEYPAVSNRAANENPAVIAAKVAENQKPSSDGGKKRRTCYECGVPGHISSDCPKKKATDAVASSKPEYEYPTVSNGAANENPPIIATKVAENPKPSSGGGKKRRTCYECGVPGHISSDCPKKKGADAVSASS